MSLVNRPSSFRLPEYTFSENLWSTPSEELPLAEGKSVRGRALGCIRTSKAKSAWAQNSASFVPVSCLPAGHFHVIKAMGKNQIIDKTYCSTTKGSEVKEKRD
jgi:hypothetical protein